mmetsp:Transcript_11890/g.24807  ORF Transcript_11890/g.24807 Transcript_11890/m.24807 type:complete len:104 (+) Transcript_11890:70-381(+)
MGCGASTSQVLAFDPVSATAVCQDEPGACDDQGMEVTKQSTLRSWTATAVPGVPSPPNREMHESHMRRMERYVAALENSPQILSLDVADKRLVLEILLEQRPR